MSSSTLRRVNHEEALEFFQSHDLLELGQMAQQVRRALNPQRIVTYVVDRNINYTNACVSGCRFCAFYRSLDARDAYILQRNVLREKLEELEAAGGTQILLQGGLHPRLKLDFFEDLFRFVKHEFPSLTLHALSAPEIVHLSHLEQKSIEDILKRLQEAGLDSIPGGGAEILSDRVRRQLSPGKCSADEWVETMRIAHRLGIGSTATMMFGHVETLEERVAHLQRLRNLQDETGGFRAFICWTFQPRNTALEGSVRAHLGSYDYLKTLAVSRIYLDNFPHVQASWVTQTPKIGQLALHFGADDMGGTMMEENVVRSAGVHYSANERQLRELISEAGFIPAKRDTWYRIMADSSSENARVCR